MKQLIDDRTLGALAGIAFVISIVALVGMLFLEEQIVLWWLAQ